MKSTDEDYDPWRQHYEIAFMTGRTVGLQVGFLIGISSGVVLMLLACLFFWSL